MYIVVCDRVLEIYELLHIEFILHLYMYVSRYLAETGISLN